MKTKTPLRWILGAFKAFYSQIFIVSLLSAAVSLCGVFMVLQTRNILNSAATGNVDYKSIIILASVLVFQLLSNMVVSFLKSKTIAKMDVHLKHHLFNTLIKKDYGKIRAIHSGEIINRFTSDIDVVVQGFGSLIPTTVAIVTKLLSGMAVFIVLEPRIAIIVLAVGFGIPLIGRLLSKPYKTLHKETQRTNGIVRSFLQESVQNMVVVKTFVADGPVKDRLDNLMQDNLRIKIKRALLSSLMHTSLHGSFTIAYYGVIIWGAFGIMAGSLPYGTFIAFLQLISQLRAPLQSVSGILPQYYSTLASAERLMEIEGIEDEQIGHGFSVDYSKLTSIEGRGLCFSYEDQRVLENADFSINKGSICAVMGESGTGKSTLFRLLLGLYHAESGALSLKTTEGETPLTAANRSLFSYVPQGAMMLSGTIRDNITLLSGERSDEEIKHAAQQAVIYDFIKTLPQGFDTPLGEQGLGLSEGQLQRIAIARALASDAPILLLDECTSALDNETECQLLENLKKETDKTVILITHRPAALDICDRVLYIKDGKIEDKNI